MNGPLIIWFAVATLIVFGLIAAANAGTRNPPLNLCQPLGWDCVPPLEGRDD